MKKKYFIIIVMMFINSYVNGQWQTLHYISDSIPLPWINSVSFTNTNDGLAACSGTVSYSPGNPDSFYKGSIIKTTDGGVTWNNAFNVDTGMFVKIVHTNPNCAFAVGSIPNYGVIAKTSDAGSNWDTTLTPIHLNSLSFPSNSIGYVSAANGIVLKTTNSGANWNIITTPVLNNLTSCIFLNDTVGFVAGDSVLLKTNDGGANWSSQYIGNTWCQIIDISFPTYNTGYLLIYKVLIDSIGNQFENYCLYKTINNGNQWNYIATLDASPMILSSMDFPNDLIGYIDGQFQMYKTIDGGYNWFRQYAGLPAMPDFMDDLMTVFFLNADTGFAAGSSQFYRTYNGGDSLGTMINELQLNNTDFIIFPNPTSNKINIELKKINSFDNISISLFDIQGRLILQIPHYNYKTEIDLSNLFQGVYFIKLNSNNSNFVTKIIKE